MCHRVPGFQRFPQGSGFLHVPRVPEGFWGFPKVPKVPRFQGSKVSKFPKDPKLSEILEIPKISNILLDLWSAQGSQFLCLLRFPRFVGLTISQWPQVMFWHLIFASSVFMDMDFIIYCNVGMWISSVPAVWVRWLLSLLFPHLFHFPDGKVPCSNRFYIVFCGSARTDLSIHSSRHYIL